MGNLQIKLSMINPLLLNTIPNLSVVIFYKIYSKIDTCCEKKVRKTRSA